MSSQLEVLVSECTDLVNAGQFAEALVKADAALAIDPNSPGAALAKAVCLSQLGNSSEASAAFDHAIKVGPGDAKTRFNAAVHEFNLGNVDVARSLAQQALELDSRHEGAKNLLQRIPAPAGQAASYPRDLGMHEEMQSEGIPFIRNLGSKWVTIGWTLVAIGVVSLVYTIITLLPHVSEISAAVKSQDQAKMNALVTSLANPFLQVFAYAHIGTILMWVILDLIHRRGNMMWLIAHIPCTCCCGAFCGLPFLSLPIYILFGRKS
jgi:tetratricopeptide (TPR) repeat protein